MISLKGKKVALVMSGGGAKGAYQMGMLRALEEAGLEKEKLIMAGTSIGALNALMYASDGIDGIREIFRFCGELTTIIGMEELTERFYPDRQLRENRVPVTACAYSYERKRPEYFLLNDYSPEEQRLLAAASASLPPVYPPVEFRGELYSDGARIPEGLEGAAPPEKIPVKALKDSGYDVMIVSFLKPEDTVDHSFVPDHCLYLESRPSVPLEDKPGTGTVDYRPKRVSKSEEMGYQETKALLEG
ncbi:MAG: patatin-like phospholipase family protein [Stomatobaculum sp.]|nr:patatin-like phospholipase family protein [Stomatobaculum sp.]